MIKFVYKKGVDYNEKSLSFFKAQCPKAEQVNLVHDYRGWWAKMELFRPDIEGDFLYLDMDTVIRGDLLYLEELTHSACLDDFFYNGKRQSGVMFLTQKDRAKVWDVWIKSPDSIMAKYHGDADFIFTVIEPPFLQDMFPDKIISYKAHVKKICSNFKEYKNICNSDIICFHGKPRPWDLSEGEINGLL